MVRSCVVFSCKTHSKRDQDAHFYRIPAIKSENNCYLRNNEENHRNLIQLSKRRQKAWLNALKLGNFNESQLKNARICHKHFLSGIQFDSLNFLRYLMVIK